MKWRLLVNRRLIFPVLVTGLSAFFLIVAICSNSGG